MNGCDATISDLYKSSLQNYLRGEGESALRDAYELGRRSITEELRSVDLVVTHQEALLHILKDRSTTGDPLQLIQASGQFLLETLSPFEMAIRGYREALETLKASEAQVRSLAKRVLNAQEEERQRLARELHDDLCQWLTGMKLSLNLLEEELPVAKPLREELRILKEQINQKIVDVRRLSVSLRPPALDDFGLVVALSRLSEDCGRLYKIPITFHALGPVPEHYHHELETALYRITQEGLSNMGKHSKARRGRVSISHVDHAVALNIQDDGVGLDETKLSRQNGQDHHMGLVSMKERAALLGGAFRIVSQPDRGTEIHVEIPLESALQ